MKHLRIANSEKKHGKVRRLAKRVVKIGLVIVIVLSYALNRIFFHETRHISKYDYENLTKEYGEFEGTQLNKELFGCIREATGNSPGEIDSEDFSSLSLDSQFNKINNYLQNQKINVFNLDIYLFKDKRSGNNQRGHWKIAKGRDLYIINFAKALLTNNLTRLVSSIQNFIFKGGKTQEFLFYSEVFIKILFLILLTRFLQERSPLDRRPIPQEEALGELLNILYKLAVNLLQWDTSFISMLPPSNVQRISSFNWTTLSVCTIVVSTLLEEYARNDNNSNKERNIFLRKSFQFAVEAEIVILIFMNFYIATSRERYLEKRMAGVLFIVNKLVLSIVEVITHWKSELGKKIYEKAL